MLSDSGSRAVRLGVRCSVTTAVLTTLQHRVNNFLYAWEEHLGRGYLRPRRPRFGNPQPLHGLISEPVWVRGCPVSCSCQDGRESGGSQPFPRIGLIAVRLNLGVIAMLLRSQVDAGDSAAMLQVAVRKFFIAQKLSTTTKTAASAQRLHRTGSASRYQCVRPLGTS